MIRLRGFGPVDIGGLVVAAAMAAVWYTQSVEPVLTTSVEASRLEAELQEVSRAEERLRSSVERLSAGVDGLKATIDERRVRLRSSDDINARIAELGDLAQGGGLRLDRLRPEAAQDAGPYRAVRLSIGGEGSYSDIAAFFHAFRNQFPDVGVERIELTTGENPTAQRFTLEMVWYAAPVTFDARADREGGAG